MKQNLKALLSDIISWPDHLPPIEITGIQADSRMVQPGDVFLACAAPEARTQHITQAIQQGATAVLQDEEGAIPIENNIIPSITLPKLSEKIGVIAARFYGNPSTRLKVVGITGTNGKTSCSQFIARVLTQHDSLCGIIGTLGNGFPDQLQSGIYTTPDPVGLQQLLAQLQQAGAKNIAMEVSSFGLAQHRVAGVRFDIGVFTNLTQDHLDYHITMENYGAAKRQLFLQPGLKHAVINADDAFGRKLLQEFAPQLACYAYTTEAVKLAVPTISAQDIKLTAQGFSAKISSPWGEGVLQSSLLGRFNLSNLLAVLTTLALLELPLKDILHYLSTLTTVPGRMQGFGGGKLPLVVVDYAHTPDALEKALTALREHCQNKLWCVFGCGGDRDKGKRKKMGQIAERYSDQIIITDDNPRHEDPTVISNSIIEGLLCPWAAEVEHDRHAAIAHAIDCAQTGDVVLIAGKGHETYQTIGDNKIPFNDAEQVQLQLALKMKQAVSI